MNSLRVSSTPRNLFKKLEMKAFLFRKNNRFYCFRAAFDYESYFCKENLPPPPTDLRLEWASEYNPILVSVESNVPGFLETKCFVSNRSVD